jgi:DnaJ-class molecular chaperone
MKNYYEILEVSPKASKEIIEKAYKVLAKKYHPDRYSEEEKIYADEKLKELNVAYKILSDDLLRDQYDSELNKERQKSTQREEKGSSTKKENIIRNKKNSKVKEEQNFKNNGAIGLAQRTFTTLIGAIKNIKSIDYKALGLTILVMIALGTILWILPFTHDFIYNNFIGVFK